MHQIHRINRVPGPKLALVMWGGFIGGAETLSVALAQHMRGLGADVTVVFIQRPWSLAERLGSAGVPYRSLQFGRGRDVIRHPRRYARAVSDEGTDGALLLECGFMGGALRAGGYGGRIVAIEHGTLLGLGHRPRLRQLLWHIARRSGTWADDAEVAVSDCMLDLMRRHSHARRTQRIYNGIDPAVFMPRDGSTEEDSGDVVVGFASRLVEGKGADHLIRAAARANQQTPVRLVIAGDGPERPRLESLVRTLDAGRVEFRGVVDDAPGFWRSCDIAAVPTDAISESFSMATVEAMACGLAIVASRTGAIPELMIDGVTGTLVEPGDVGALTQAIVRYAQRPELRREHGGDARVRAIEHFHIDDCARSYLDLFREPQPVKA